MPDVTPGVQATESYRTLARITWGQLWAVARASGLGLLGSQVRWLPPVSVAILLWWVARSPVSSGAEARGVLESHWAATHLVLWWLAAGVRERDRQVRILPMLRARPVPGWVYLAGHAVSLGLMSAAMMTLAVVVVGVRAPSAWGLAAVLPWAVCVWAHAVAWTAGLIALCACLPRGLVLAIWGGTALLSGVDLSQIPGMPAWLTWLQWTTWAVLPVDALPFDVWRQSLLHGATIALENILFGLTALWCGGWCWDRTEPTQRS